MDDRDRAVIRALHRALGAQGFYPYPLSRATAACVGPVDFGCGTVYVAWCPMVDGGHLWSSATEPAHAPHAAAYEVPCPEHDDRGAALSESPEQGEGWKHMDALSMNGPDEDDDEVLPPPFCGW